MTDEQRADAILIRMGFRAFIMGASPIASSTKRNCVMNCTVCNGVGQVLPPQRGDFPFSPGLSRTMACKCPSCSGEGTLWRQRFNEVSDYLDEFHRRPEVC